ncbi:MAG: LacI family transcriptional regulator, partial [Bdellovibrionaceae bacterium]|nr:LacI family transcriptional regulator [Pseudobdellovibrionaceae bacterium]
MATVSAALNRSAPVSESTRAKVLAAAVQLGYSPNGIARSLRRGHTRLIALVVSDITNPFFGALARAMETVALESGFAVIVSNTDEDHERERDGMNEQRGFRDALAPLHESQHEGREIERQRNDPQHRRRGDVGGNKESRP